jgi:murein DD-endopeptidase MepM/ murein hydrolase activator NlpD
MMTLTIKMLTGAFILGATFALGAVTGCESDYDGDDSESITAQIEQALVPCDGEEGWWCGPGGGLAWPTPGNHVVTSGFGMRWHPIYKKMKMHNGIDISADLGDSIVSVRSGKVSGLGYDAKLGNWVTIKHDYGLETKYQHIANKQTYVKIGDIVSKGMWIAGVGSTGDSTGSHLHFQITENGRLGDPCKYLNCQ